MIAFNGTYLPTASHGNYRITAAAIGGQWVMVPWHIAAATQQAIIAAFGTEEGIAVISKTNDYLSQIDATDPQRVQQLAGFINEDPLLVTSLVETSKIRWLVGDGKAFIDSDFYAKSQKYKVSVKFSKNGSQESNWRSICGINLGTSGEKQYALFQFNNITEDALVFHNTDANVSVSVPLNLDKFTASMEYENSRTICKLNGVEVGTLNGTIDSHPHYGYGIFAAKKNEGSFYLPATKGGLAFYIFEEESNEHHLCPFIRNGENGMLDILSGTFYPNANTSGQFTIQLTEK